MLAKYALGHEKYKADPGPCIFVKSDINVKLEAIYDGMNEEYVFLFFVISKVRLNMKITEISRSSGCSTPVIT